MECQDVFNDLTAELLAHTELDGRHERLLVLAMTS